MIINSEVMLTRSQIDTRCAELGELISEDYKRKRLVMLCVLNGAFMFAADLCKHISINMEIDFIQVSSYKGGKTSTGLVELHREPRINLQGKDILIVEDIIDTGLTASWLKRYFIENHNIKSYQVCALISKHERRFTESKIDYVGFSIEKGFVVGYGMDYNELYRNLPEIHCLKGSK